MKVLIELDKAGAEWVCVAYLSGDANMLEVIESGKSPHTVTGSLISGSTYEFVERESKVVGLNTDPDTIAELRESLLDEIQPEWFLPRIFSIRQMGKKSNHGLNYDMKYRRFALENEIEEKEAERIVTLYHRQAYPSIKIWHKTIQSSLRDDRTLTNCFGRKRRFMDAWGPELWDAAYSFLPQSTVFDITRIGMVKTYNNSQMDAYELLAQTHDSVTYQTELNTKNYKQVANDVVKIGLDYMNPLCVYNSREFYIGTTMKIGTDWGDMHECVLDEDISATADSVKETMLDGKKAA
jgi:DNA polymerase I-like protein with 3'-5' exonuclease and polymerase domains|tara:strand:- start:2172 stop:3056 length:885 start_codon:yes stop_codon:yes gene_type:complete